MPGAYPSSKFFQCVVLLTALTAAASSAADSTNSDVLSDSAAEDPQAQNSSQLADAILQDRSIAGRVLGGDDAQEGEWPSMVALVRVGNRPLASRLFCGGTVVAERWVLTAAHCLFTTGGFIENPSSIRVVADVLDLRDDDFADEVIVSNIFVHPEYDNTIGLPPNDIALLELATAVSAPPSKLFAGDTTLYTGSLGFIVGWGATAFVNNVGTDLPGRLQDATVPLVSLETCNDPVAYNGIVTSRQLCAGFEEGGIDTCSGDSGGPIFIIENGEVAQVGITSFGDGCGLPDRYGIYTDVSQFISWIGNFIEVPAQSDDLIAMFEARDLGLSTGGSTSGDSVSGGSAGGSSDGGFLGAFQPLSALVLGLMVVLRRFTAPLKAKTLLSAASVLLLLTGCSVSSATTKTDNALALAGTNDDNSAASLTSNEDVSVALATAKEGTSVSSAAPKEVAVQSLTENSAMLEFNEQSGRPGIGELMLGQSRDTAMAAIAQWPVAQANCQAQQTGLKGTGRAFYKETCVFASESAYDVSELAVQQVTLQFLDETVIGLKLVAVGEVMNPLIEQLNARYQQSDTAARPFEWASTSKDAIRLMTATAGEQDNLTQVSVELIDASTDGRLPGMFEL